MTSNPYHHHGGRRDSKKVQINLTVCSSDVVGRVDSACGGAPVNQTRVRETLFYSSLGGMIETYRWLICFGTHSGSEVLNGHLFVWAKEKSLILCLIHTSKWCSYVPMQSNIRPTEEQGMWVQRILCTKGLVTCLNQFSWIFQSQKGSWFPLSSTTTPSNFTNHRNFN